MSSAYSYSSMDILDYPPSSLGLATPSGTLTAFGMLLHRCSAYWAEPNPVVPGLYRRLRSGAYPQHPLRYSPLINSGLTPFKWGRTLKHGEHHRGSLQHSNSVKTTCARLPRIELDSGRRLPGARVWRSRQNFCREKYRHREQTCVGFHSAAEPRTPGC